MKILLFNVNKDEVQYIYDCNKRFDFELVLADFDFNTEDTKKFRGFDAIWIVTNCVVNENKAKQLSKAGVRYIVSRAAGTDHIDLEAIRKAGIRAANVPRYSPNAIAEHTLCLILMVLRKMKRELLMIDQYDFSLNGLKGRELRNMTVGVIGTGRIGAETIKCLSGFGCRIIANDLYENAMIKDKVRYVEYEELLKDSDIIVLHCPLTEENHRMIRKESINLMKDRVVLINTARGALVNYEDVLEAIEVGKISAAAFDVFDKETPYIRKKVTPEALESETLKKLMQKENVIYTAHMSFFTDTAIENMIMTSFENLKEYHITGSCSNEIL